MTSFSENRRSIFCFALQPALTLKCWCVGLGLYVLIRLEKSLVRKEFNCLNKRRESLESFGKAPCCPSLSLSLARFARRFSSFRLSRTIFFLQILNLKKFRRIRNPIVAHFHMSQKGVRCHLTHPDYQKS